MKIVKTLMAAVAVAFMAAQPVAASQAAQKLSLTNAAPGNARVAMKAGKSKASAGIPTFALILGAIAIVALIVVVTDNSDSK